MRIIAGECVSLPLARAASSRLRADLESPFWKRGVKRIAGVDEVGRGPLAGPVVAAALIFPPDTEIPRLNDSKRLSPRTRAALFPRILERSVSVSVGLVTAGEIDRSNIREAALEAMFRALHGLEVEPDWVLVDGVRSPGFPSPQIAVIGGDGKVPSIAAASVVAKVFRDRLMLAYHRIFPVYRFDRHKGYPTMEHARAIAEHGLSPIHRRTFHVPDTGEGAAV